MPFFYYIKQTDIYIKKSYKYLYKISCKNVVNEVDF